MKNSLNVWFSIFIGFSILLGSCSSDKKEDAPAVEEVQNDYAEQVYNFSPAFDSINCSNSGAGCDCCYSDLVFLNETEFIVLGWCIWNDHYYRGEYEVFKDRIELNFQKDFVVREYNEAYEFDTTGTVTTTHFIKIKEGKERCVILDKYTCGGEPWLYWEDEYEKLYGCKMNKSIDEVIAQMKEDDVWFELFP